MVRALLNIYDGAFQRKQLTSKNRYLFAQESFIVDVSQDAEFSYVVNLQEKFLSE